MWLMGYREVGGGGGGAQEISSMNTPAADSFINGRKLRPLIPRPCMPTSTTSTAKTNTTAAAAASTTNTTVSCFGSDIFTLNSHCHLMAGEDHQSKKNTTAQVVMSPRWNPTPEQLRILEDLYRRGTRTPSAEQIQHITAQLRRYGKIEGKNVFYWFQNHKARERQKRRRELDLLAPPPAAAAPPHHHQLDINIERKDRGAISFEEQQTNNWDPSLNCSPPPATQEESEVVVSTQRTTKEAAVAGGQTEGGGTHFQEPILQARQIQSQIFHHQNYATTATRSFGGEKNATWQHQMHLSYSSFHSYPSVTCSNIAHHLNSTTTPPPTLTIKGIMGNKQLEEVQGGGGSGNGNDSSDHEEEVPQTLQLFPLRSREDWNDAAEGKGEGGKIL
ncbi:hypothetical protein Ancab_038713 [Ancistrocladus abbreviatus]